MRAAGSARGTPSLWAWIAGLVAALTILLVATQPSTVSAPGDRSSFANGPAGTLALADLLRARGDTVTRLTGSGFARAIQTEGVVVEAGPSRPFTAAQSRALVGWVTRGGTLLYAAARPLVDGPVLRALGVGLGPAGPAVAAAPLLPVLPPGAGRVRLGRAHRLRALVPEVLPLVVGAAGPLAVARPLGRGQLYVLGSTAALDNAGLDRGGNAAFVLGLLARAPDRRVLIDEIHHGYVSGTGSAALVFGTPLWGAILILLAATVIAGATQGRRLGRPLPPPELAVVRSTDDHLRAIAGLYARTADRGTVAGRVRAQLEEVVRSVTGSPPHADTHTLARAVAAEHRDETGAVLAVLAGLTEMERSPASPRRLVELTRQADACARRLSPTLAPGPTDSGTGSGRP